MYLRFAYSRLKPESVDKFQKVYSDKIIPRLEKVPGCLYCGLIVTEPDHSEGFSITLWDTIENQEEYEKSGLYQENVNEIRDFLSGTSDQKIMLSDDFKLEYVSLPKEPEVRSYTTIAQSKDIISSQDNEFIANLKLVTIKVQPEKLVEFRKIYEEEIMPALKNVKGCRFAVLTESLEYTNELISITFWDSENDMENYGNSGKFDELNDKVKHTYTGVYRWKMAIEKEKSKQAVTSDDLQIKYYRLLTGKSFR